MTDVLVLGSINRDLVMSLSQLPTVGETVTGGTLKTSWGGKGANQAVAACRHGAKVAMLGAVGGDEAGADARVDLANEGVDVDQVHIVPDTATGTAFVMVREDGSNQIAVAPGANTYVAPEGMARFDGMPVLLACFEIPLPTVVEGLATAARKKWTSVINPAPASSLPDAFHGSGVILTPNHGELMKLQPGNSADEAALALAALTDGPVITTLGEQGALVVQPGGDITHIPAPKVPAVDTTGAGDAFNGVLAAELSWGTDLLEATRLAVVAGSMAVGIPGARGKAGSTKH